MKFRKCFVCGMAVAVGVAVVCSECREKSNVAEEPRYHVHQETPTPSAPSFDYSQPLASSATLVVGTGNFQWVSTGLNAGYYVWGSSKKVLDLR